jgi:hypothetical protein
MFGLLLLLFVQISKAELKKIQVESAILKPMINSRDKDDTFVLFSQPTEESVIKRKKQEELGLPDDEDDEYAYECVREYTCTIIRNDETKRNYFIVFRDQIVFYNECPSSLALHIRGTVILFVLNFILFIYFNLSLSLFFLFISKIFIYFF